MCRLAPEELQHKHARDMGYREADTGPKRPYNLNVRGTPRWRLHQCMMRRVKCVNHGLGHADWIIDERHNAWLGYELRCIARGLCRHGVSPSIDRREWIAGSSRPDASCFGGRCGQPHLSFWAACGSLWERRPCDPVWRWLHRVPTHVLEFNVLGEAGTWRYPGIIPLCACTVFV